MKKEKKKPKKCETCAYTWGLVKTFINPCPGCTGKTSIFSNYPTVPIDFVKILEKKEEEDF